MALLVISNATIDQKKEILKYAAEFYKSEVENFWRRSIFFWGFIAAAFVAYAQLYDKGDDLLPLFVGCFGLVCSIAWTLLNRGSKYWYEAWEQKVKVVQADVLGCELFSNIEPLKKTGWWGPGQYSVSRLTIALSDFTVLVWFALVAKASPVLSAVPWSRVPEFILAATALYVVAMLLYGQSRLPPE